MNFNEKIRVRRCFAESIRRDKNPKPTVVGFARTCVGRFPGSRGGDFQSPTQSTRYPIYFLKFIKFVLHPIRSRFIEAIYSLM
jgi:hypothetical protein